MFSGCEFQRLSNHGWVKEAYVHWTGGKGSHVIGEFESNLWHEVDRVKGSLRQIIFRLCKDVSIFLSEQMDLTDPYVIVDLQPMIRRGLY